MAGAMWFLLGVAATVGVFRYLDGCWVWERPEKLFMDEFRDEDKDQT